MSCSAGASCSVLSGIGCPCDIIMQPHNSATAVSDCYSELTDGSEFFNTDWMDNYSFDPSFSNSIFDCCESNSL